VVAVSFFVRWAIGVPLGVRRGQVIAQARNHLQGLNMPVFPAFR
jgi:hypothetical protein